MQTCKDRPAVAPGGPPTNTLMPPAGIFRGRMGFGHLASEEVTESTKQHAHNTVDGRNPAPPKKPWNDDSPRTYQQTMVSHGFQVVRNGFRPSTVCERKAASAFGFQAVGNFTKNRSRGLDRGTSSGAKTADPHVSSLEHPEERGEPFLKEWLQPLDQRFEYRGRTKGNLNPWPWACECLCLLQPKLVNRLPHWKAVGFG